MNWSAQDKRNVSTKPESERVRCGASDEDVDSHLGNQPSSLRSSLATPRHQCRHPPRHQRHPRGHRTLLARRHHPLATSTTTTTTPASCRNTHPTGSSETPSSTPSPPHDAYHSLSHDHCHCAHHFYHHSHHPSELDLTVSFAALLKIHQWSLYTIEKFSDHLLRNHCSFVFFSH